MTRVEAVSFDDRSTTMGIDSDARGNLAILVRDDEKLHATTHGVDNLVDTERGDHQHHIAIDDLLPVVKNKIRRGDDDNIAEHDDTPQRDVTILVDNGSHDVRAAGRPIVGQSQSHAAAAEDGADDACHERLVGQQMRVGKIMARQGGQ